MDFKKNSFLFKSAIVGALGGLLFGFDTAVISGTTKALTAQYSLSPEALGITVASALWGTVFSAMTSGLLGEKLGSREMLRLAAVLYVVSALGCALAWNWSALLLFRLIGGLGIGCSSVLGPVYIAELAPAKWRGRLVGLFQINIVVGILLAYFSNFLIGSLALGTTEWRWKLGIAAAPAALFLAMLFSIPRSPRWLAAKDRLDEARSILKQIANAGWEHEFERIVENVRNEHPQKSEALFQKKYRLPIFLALATGMFNQLTGINAILYYLNDIFARAGFSKMSGDLQAVAVGATNLIFTLLAMCVIDKLGRKSLLLIGAAGTALCLAGIATIFSMQQGMHLLVWFLMAYIAFFAISQGAVIWVYLSEIFPTPVRAVGQSLGCSTHWVMNALISGLFPIMARSSGAYPFAFFCAMMILQFVVVWLVYPETKGISLEDMEKRLAVST